MMRYLSEHDLTNLITPHSLIAAIERGLIDALEQKMILRAGDHIAFDDSTLLTMPVVGGETFGTNVMSVRPSNVSRGSPAINGLMTLFDRTSGLPRAVLNAAALAAQGAAAVGALGLKYTTPSNIDRLGIIGTCVHGAWQAIYACAVRPIRMIYFLAHSDEKATAFADTVARHWQEVELVRCTDAASLVGQSQAIFTATTSNSPVLPNDRRLLENRHLLSVDSFQTTVHELPDAAFELARQIVVDSDVAKQEVGNLIDQVGTAKLRRSDLVGLADLVAGHTKLTVNTTTIFKSVGMALYDHCAAQMFYAAAEADNRGTKLQL